VRLVGDLTSGPKLSWVWRPKPEVLMSEKLMQKCDLCGSEYQYGPHNYDGKFIRKYQLKVCMSCYEGNWDGWAPHLEIKLIAHLKERGLAAPARNEKGWIPRE
ncbi:MAG: hypothetical protein V3U03_01095, partial [Myxococcota bacterium]